MAGLKGPDAIQRSIAPAYQPHLSRTRPGFLSASNAPVPLFEQGTTATSGRRSGVRDLWRLRLVRGLQAFGESGDIAAGKGARNHAAGRLSEWHRAVAGGF